ncbi:response regulator transcription factor [Aquabacterium sp. OR-4]|uniref:response regulator transcription factor n=1 Tax=Aquabacterium sp. OR-4 TaxID=2978127 RepID=UPI0028C83C5D|nr:response regulator transcription factor [Aquabacterium sp. OR-4]MDT7834644.1 response regulator transcription factor [Aquabacterium sp. OR-4]
MRALLIDDEQLVLDGMDAYLQVALPDLSIDKTSDLPAALQLVATVPYRLVLLDWHLVDGRGQPIDGQGVVEALRRAGSRAPILLVSGEDPQRCKDWVHRLGLAGHVPKSASGAALVAAIHTVLAGGTAWPDDAAQARARAAARREPASADDGLQTEALRLRFPELTERQAEVLKIMVQGAGDKQIARTLDLSLNTVRSHVRGVLAAVGVNRRGEAVFRALSPEDNGQH